MSDARSANCPPVGLRSTGVAASVELERLGGIATWQELERNVSKSEVRRAVSAGEIVRVRRGVYSLPAVDAARAAAARLGGVVSHASAALAHGWKVKFPSRAPAVTVGRGRKGLDTSGVEVHWGDIRGQGQYTDPERTVIDCARTLPFDEALAIADSALRSRLVTPEQLLAGVASPPRTGRTKALEVVRAASPLAANPFESVLRAIASMVSCLDVQPQGEIDEQTHPDLVDFDLRIVIEAESFGYHALPEAFAHDVRRYTRLVRAGWTVLRFTWDDVMHRPEYVRAVLVDVSVQRHAQLGTSRHSSV